MIAMSRTTKLAIIFSAIAIGVGISIMLVTGYNKTLIGLFLGAVHNSWFYFNAKMAKNIQLSIIVFGIWLLAF